MHRYRAEETKPEYKELSNYLKYVTRELFSKKATVALQYVLFNTGSANERGVLVNFTHYDITHKADPHKQNAAAVIQNKLFKDAKPVFWNGRAYSGEWQDKSYFIVGEVKNLRDQAAQNDPERFKEAQEWAKQQSAKPQ